MPHEGYADPVTNDGPGFHSDLLISELTKHATRAIEASDVSSTPPDAETMDGVTITKMSRPSTKPCYVRRLEESWTRKETKRVVTE